MTKLVLLSLLLLSLTPAHGLNPSKPCPPFVPSPNHADWTWMDRDCRIRTRAELGLIVGNHYLWLSELGSRKGEVRRRAANGAFRHAVRADLSGAVLEYADLRGYILNYADLTGAHLEHANLTLSGLQHADLTDAWLLGADLTGAHLDNADLTHAILTGADLTDAWLADANLTGAYLGEADLTDAVLDRTDLTDTNLLRADLSSTSLQGTDFSGADLTLTKLWYADFEPKIPPPVNSIARAEGLQTLRWLNSFDELIYRSRVAAAGTPDSWLGMPPAPSLTERWMLWLSRYREILMGQTKGWRDDLGFLWNDALYGLQPHQAKNAQSGASPTVLQLAKIPLEAQNKYELIDLRTALNRAGYSEAELQVNLAYQRHTQSALGMILYDWTCEYGAAPFRPLMIALALALLVVPIYWLGIRQNWFGSQLLLVEKRGQEEIETPLGSPLTRPCWHAQFPVDPPSSQARPEKLPERLRLWLASNWLRLRQLIVSVYPRLRWEAGFIKAVVLFSLIGIVNLGFEGLDFGRWVRNLTFHEYDLKARGWLRTASGLQSLVGLALLALSLLSFFGHRFE